MSQRKDLVMRPRSNALAIVIATLLSLPTICFAIDTVTSCGYTCVNDCRLPTTGLTCCSNASLPQCNGGSSGPITLSNGSDLDFNGGKLTCFCGTKTCNGGTNNNAVCTVSSECPSGTCSDNTGCSSCNSAVTMSANSSVVKNTGAADGGVVAGATSGWYGGVACANKTNSRVTGIRIEATNYGTSDCWQTDKNVIVGAAPTAGTGVKSTGAANTDSIHDNYIDNWLVGVSVDSDFNMSVDHNLVVGRSGSHEGIDTLLSGGTMTIESNLLQGSGFLSVGCGALCAPDERIFIQAYAPSSVVSGNYCDPENPGTIGHRGVYDDCEVPVSPFVLP